MDDSEEAQSAAAKWQAFRWSLHPVFALVAGGCLLALRGWIGKINGWVHGCTVMTGIVFSLERAWSYWSRRRERRTLTFRLMLPVLVFCGSVPWAPVQTAQGQLSRKKARPKLDLRPSFQSISIPLDFETAMCSGSCKVMISVRYL